MKPLFANLFGPPGSGKSTLGFTFPPPFHYARFDRRSDKIIADVRKRFGESAVVEESFIPDLGETLQDRSQEFLDKTMVLADKAVKLGEGTFFIDGGNRFWEVVQKVKLPSLVGLSDDEREKKEKMRRLLYADANEYLGNLLLAVENSPINVVITHHTKGVYDAQGKETDYVRPDYFKQVPYTATLEVFMITSAKLDVNMPSARAYALSLDGKSQQVELPPKFYGQITQCKDDTEMVGQMLPNPTFKILYGMALSEPWPGETWQPPFIP